VSAQPCHGVTFTFLTQHQNKGNEENNKTLSQESQQLGQKVTLEFPECKSAALTASPKFFMSSFLTKKYSQLVIQAMHLKKMEFQTHGIQHVTLRFPLSVLGKCKL
jgi:hypothetical protein